MRAIAATAALILGTAISLPAMGQQATTDTTSRTPLPGTPPGVSSRATIGAGIGPMTGVSPAIGPVRSPGGDGTGRPQPGTPADPAATSLNSTGMAGGFGTSRRTTIGQGGATGTAQSALGSTLRSPVDPMGRAMTGATGGSTLGGGAAGSTGSRAGHAGTTTGGAASGTTGGL
ncbi:hypothetical protein C8K11_1163 [Novosphingobium sp. GV055]|nr:hypothetical protein C8K11_1163 [Novosphingobium sp. GV055]PUB00021.1 hypothetical protein C8K12_1163 [Novosphingobium sp. GV061]PUB14991.1 hypothetical protein C8K14_1163 [Novosphingobium sp. GV079]PUB39050.1 hypothetical protein C8K10_1163 [Novosphingobium sp. GV027]